MNILMINPAHPSTPHISATRAWRFSQELAKLGHRVVLLCNANTEGQLNDGSDMLSHDWAEPYVLAPAMLHSEESSWPSPIRKVQTSALMLLYGGRQWRWQKAAVAAVSEISGHFRPDVVWATFGTMEAVFAAKAASKRSGAPWVLDLKDSWQIFVPYSMRRIMALRVLGYSAITANATCSLKSAPLSHTSKTEVIYSGVDDVFFSAAPLAGNGGAVINIIGGLYEEDVAQAAMHGMRLWLEGLSETERSAARLVYMGSDAKRFKRLIEMQGLEEHSEVLGYLSIEEMAARCRAATANLYVTLNKTFHHKLLELIACGRPVIAFGGENEEAKRLAKTLDADMFEPRTSQDLATILQTLNNTALKCRRDSVRAYSWPAQTLALADVLGMVEREVHV